MRSTSLLLILSGFCFCLSACHQPPQQAQTDTAVKPDMHNSMNALDWFGTYRGTLPCADCEGIKTSLTLNQDKTYHLSRTYLGKEDKVFEQQGTFSWNAAGNTITLEQDTEAAQQYFVGENTLTQLDREGNKITGALAQKYILMKGNTQASIEDTHWKLVELIGKSVDSTINGKEAFIMLNSDDKRISGNGGCNTIMGSYELLEGNRIRFSKIAASLMACPDMEVEAQLLKVLESADNYSWTADQMTLNKARMAPLARFVAVSAHE